MHSHKALSDGNKISKAPEANNGEVMPEQVLSNNFFTSLSPEILFYICSYTNPWNLYYLSRVDKRLLILARQNEIWKEKVFLHFSNAANNVSQSDYQLFAYQSKNQFRNLSYKKKEIFTLVYDNDAYSIKDGIEKRKIQFDIELLTSCDLQNNSLLNLVRKMNNPDLNDSIFAQLCENNSYGIETLIRWGINLDLSNDFFVELLKSVSINEIVINRSDTLLYYAVNMNSLNSLELLLKLKADPNKRTNGNSSPLYLAAQEGRLEMVKLLIDYKAEIEYTFRDGYTPLYVAAQKGHIDIVEFLHKKKANINIRCIHGSSPLYIAAQEGNVRIVEFLLKHDADIEVTFKGFTVLYVASRNGHDKVVRVLLEYLKNKSPDRLSTFINQPGEEGSTALYVAAQNGRDKVCKILLEYKANINCQFLGGYTPLYIACQNGHEKTVEILLQFNPAINDISPAGATSLYVAAQNGYKNIVRMLLEAGANVNLLYHNEFSLLYVAVYKGYIEVTETVLKYRPNINQQTSLGDTALHQAVSSGNKDLVHLLLDKGANSNLFTNIKQSTPLHIACSSITVYNRSKYESIIEALLKAGANPDAKDTSGKIPLDLITDKEIRKDVDKLIKRSQSIEEKIYEAASQGKLEEIVFLYSSASIIDVNFHAKNGETALYIAAKNGHIEVVNYLLKNEADPNLHSNGYTPFHSVCGANIKTESCLEIIKSLIKSKANPLAKTSDGKTPADIARVPIIKNTMQFLESLAVHKNLVIEQDAIAQLNISPIKSMLEIFTADSNEVPGILTTAKTKVKVEAQIFKDLLEKVDGDFGYIVIVYMLLHKNNNDVLYKNSYEILSKQFNSDVMKPFLHNLLFDYLGKNHALFDILKNKIIEPMLKAINDQKNYSTAVYDSALINLNLFGIKVNQACLQFKDNNKCNANLRSIAPKI